MRFQLPPKRSREQVLRSLTIFYGTGKDVHFRRAIRIVCKYYKLRLPQVEWYEYIDRGRTWGETQEDGIIRLVHPESWRRTGRSTRNRTCAKWAEVVLHELGHYILWADSETKSEWFAAAMMRV